MPIIRVLMVDDSQADIDLVSLQMSKVDSDINIEGVTSSGSALEALSNDNYDLILADYELSEEEDGLQLIKRIKDTGSRIPIIFMTGWGSEEVAAEAFRVGVVDYFVKEISSAHMAWLANSIRNAVAQARAEEEKRILREKLQRSEQRYRALTESTYEVILGLDEDGKIAFSNAAMKSIFGISPEDAIGHRITEFISHYSDTELSAWVQGLELQKIIHRNVEAEGTTSAAGKRIPLEFSTSPANKASGFDYVMVVRDITARKRLLQEMERRTREVTRTKNFLTDLLNSSSDAILSLTSKGTIALWNRGSRAIFGFEGDESIGRALSDFCASSEDIELLISGMLESVKSGIWQGILLLRAKDGNTIVCECTLNPLSGKDDISHGFIAILRDVTEQKRIESELEQKRMELIQSSKLATLGEMATGVAHELNQPLNTIKIISHRLQRQLKKHKLDKEFFSGKLEVVDGQINRAAQIIDHLRNFGRLTDLELVPVEVNDALSGVFTILGEQLRSHGVDVELEIPEDLPPLRAELMRIEQVFLNIISNAQDALTNKERLLGNKSVNYRKKLSISAMSDGEGYVVLNFSDNGCGMSEDVCDRAFEPFFTTKEIGDGTGLGLSISYGIVRDFGGSIEISSEEMKGTNFRIRLPVAPEQGSSADSAF